MTAPSPKPTIFEIEPYRPGKAQAAGFDKPIKLSANENALGCSPLARAAYAHAAADLHLYPDPKASALRGAIAEKFGIDPARIVFGTGSDEVFSMACQAYLAPGDNIVQPQYAFAAWAIAGRAAGAEVKSAAERNFTVDVDAMLGAVDSRTRIVFVANPANPSGTCLPFTEIARLHAGLREDILLVLDGAYAEFAAHREDYADGMGLAEAAPNVLVTRTFSKIHGLASLRIGWGYAAAPIADVLNRIRLPFNTSAASQAAARAALQDDAFVARSAAHARDGRVSLARMLAEFGLVPLQPDANFVTAHVTPAGDRDAAALAQGLAERGVLVRTLQNYGMPDWLRITVGTEPDTERLRRALSEILR